MTLLELLKLLRRHLRLVIGLPVACAIACAVVCWGFMPDRYTSEVSIYALTKSADTGNDGVSASDLSASQMLANDFAELVDNEQVQAQAADALNMKNLNGYDININSSTTTRVLKISVTGTDPESCAVVANKLADVVGDTAVRVMDVKAVNVISKAQAAETPSGPSRMLYTLVAFLAGLLFAIAIVVLRDMIDTTVRTEEDASELLGLPVIGRYPYEKGGIK